MCDVMTSVCFGFDERFILMSFDEAFVQEHVVS